MTAPYEPAPGAHEPRHASGPPDQPGAHRPDPLPAAYRTEQPGNGWPPTGSFPTSGLPASGPPTSGLPASGAPSSGLPSSGPPTASFPTTGAPAGGHPTVPVDVGARPARSRRNLTAVIAMALSVVLLIVAVAQTVALIRLNHDLDKQTEAQVAGQKADDARYKALDARAKALEERLGHTFDSKAVAEGVLPSVFMVVAGNSSGTAFAVGKKTSDGGTYFITNFHVVDDLYTKGGREVTLRRERPSPQQFTAKIAQVSKEKDVTLLQTSQDFPRLPASSDEVASGEQIAVVGAPLGLSDSVTTGVVSQPKVKLDEDKLDYTQISAPINPGNSGGPVVNGDKQVVGIATAKIKQAEGLGFAIPIAVACQQFSVC